MRPKLELFHQKNYNVFYTKVVHGGLYGFEKSELKWVPHPVKQITIVLLAGFLGWNDWHNAADAQRCKKSPPMNGERGINMSRILLLEDDLSLINGLTFTFKSRAMRLTLQEHWMRQKKYGLTGNMIC